MAFVSTPQPKLLLQDTLSLNSRQIPGDLQTFSEPSMSCNHSLDALPVSSYTQTLLNSSTVYNFENRQCPTTENNIQILQDSPGVKDTHAFYETPVIRPEETNQSFLPVLSEEKNVEEDMNNCIMIFRQRLFSHKLSPSLHELPPQPDPSLERRRQKAKTAYKMRQNMKWDRKKMREEIECLKHEASSLQRELVTLDQKIRTLEQRVIFSDSSF